MGVSALSTTHSGPHSFQRLSASTSRLHAPSACSASTSTWSRSYVMLVECANHGSSCIYLFFWTWMGLGFPPPHCPVETYIFKWVPFEGGWFVVCSRFSIWQETTEVSLEKGSTAWRLCTFPSTRQFWPWLNGQSISKKRVYVCSDAWVVVSVRVCVWVGGCVCVRASGCGCAYMRVGDRTMFSTPPLPPPTPKRAVNPWLSPAPNSKCFVMEGSEREQRPPPAKWRWMEEANTFYLRRPLL